MVYAGDEKGRRAHSENRTDDRHNREKRSNKGQSNTRWKDAHKRDMDIVGLSAVKATNRATWDKITNSHTGDPHEGGQPEKKKNTMEYVC